MQGRAKCKDASDLGMSTAGGSQVSRPVCQGLLLGQDCSTNLVVLVLSKDCWTNLVEALRKVKEDVTSLSFQTETVEAGGGQALPSGSQSGCRHFVGGWGGGSLAGWASGR